MSDYDNLVKFYDPIMGDQVETAEFIHELVKKYSSKCKTLLELGCGTGAFLKYLKKHYKVSGLDISPLMLSVAKQKVSNIPLFEADMLSFSFEEKYASIICLNDSVNHLLKKNDWKKLFQNVYGHLSEKGIFIFDINTEYKLNLLSDSPPLIHEFDENLLITDVSKNKKGLFEWNLRVFEKLDKNRYNHYEENLIERAFGLDEVKDLISKYFKILKIYDLEKGRASKYSERLYFVVVKR